LGVLLDPGRCPVATQKVRCPTAASRPIFVELHLVFILFVSVPTTPQVFIAGQVIQVQAGELVKKENEKSQGNKGGI
tara:strand:- start:42 stop:272 length:231 start_codon:yes stop_codon:yes gene_type:complete